MKEKIYKGSSKILYHTDNDYSLALLFGDDFRISKDKVVECLGKGIINNNISAYIMHQLDMIGIDNHFIEKSNMCQQLIQAADVYPLRVHITKISSARYVTDFGIEKGFVFDEPIIDFSIKNRELNYPSINEHQIYCFGWMSKDEIKAIKKIALRVHDFLTGLFLSVGIRLVDARLEFGRVFNGEDFIIMLVDEISPDNCRLWDIYSNEPLCFEAIENNADNAILTYREVEKRLGLKKGH
jgi:phosphoribosylaminoimidazole-succinocarboxamide synthase